MVGASVGFLVGLAVGSAVGSVVGAAVGGRVMQASHRTGHSARMSGRSGQNAADKSSHCGGSAASLQLTVVVVCVMADTVVAVAVVSVKVVVVHVPHSARHTPLKRVPTVGLVQSAASIDSQSAGSGTPLHAGLVRVDNVAVVEPV